MSPNFNLGAKIWVGEIKKGCHVLTVHLWNEKLHFVNNVLNTLCPCCLANKMSKTKGKVISKGFFYVVVTENI